MRFGWSNTRPVLDTDERIGGRHVEQERTEQATQGSSADEAQREAEQQHSARLADKQRPELLVPHIREVVSGRDPQVPVTNVALLEGVIGSAMGTPRLAPVS